MAVTIKHITIGQAGLHAANSAELHAAIDALRAAGYEVDNITDDASEPWHTATIHYNGPQQIRTIQQLIGAPGAYRNRA